ncbi:hypothetical protein TWF506_009296 [Arthrobotrys conoides]|uniref:Uncharacterized protein n=1 Tax=Arthrobotrys conoides TaxID=74498 RepID=A0AAN8NDI9_9PEZI
MRGLYLEIAEAKYLKTIEVKVESSGFGVKTTSEKGFDAVDKATGVKINIRVTTFAGVKPLAEKCGGYCVIRDDVQVIQKLNSLPNRRDIMKQRTDIQDLELLLRRPIPFIRDKSLKAVESGRVLQQEGRARTFIEALRTKSLAEAWGS